MGSEYKKNYKPKKYEPMKKFKPVDNKFMPDDDGKTKNTSYHDRYRPNKITKVK